MSRQRSESVISPEELAEQGRLLYGDRWQSAVARDLGVADRTVRRWAAGVEPIHDRPAARLRQLVETRWITIVDFIGRSSQLFPF